jgi:hypothetical protein
VVLLMMAVLIVFKDFKYTVSFFKCLVLQTWKQIP